jgi:hypothetical protein
MTRLKICRYLVVYIGSDKKGTQQIGNEDLNMLSTDLTKDDINEFRESIKYKNDLRFVSILNIIKLK